MTTITIAVVLILLMVIVMWHVGMLSTYCFKWYSNQLGYLDISSVEVLICKLADYTYWFEDYTFNGLGTLNLILFALQLELVIWNFNVKKGHMGF